MMEKVTYKINTYLLVCSRSLDTLFIANDLLKQWYKNEIWTIRIANPHQFNPKPLHLVKGQKSTDTFTMDKWFDHSYF